MKALLILIVTVGTSQGNVQEVDTSLDVRQIEFASVQSCERAAARLTGSGRSTSDWAKTFALSSPTSPSRSLSGSRNLFAGTGTSERMAPPRDGNGALCAFLLSGSIGGDSTVRHGGLASERTGGRGLAHVSNDGS